MSNQKKNTIANDTSGNKSWQPFARGLLIIALLGLAILTVAHIGSVFPDFPWGDLVAIFAGISIMIAIWCWGFNSGYKKCYKNFNNCNNCSKDQ